MGNSVASKHQFGIQVGTLGQIAAEILCKYTPAFKYLVEYLKYYANEDNEESYVFILQFGHKLVVKAKA